MADDVFTYIVGGKAGDGIKKAGSSVANLFADMGRHVFLNDDYPSLIKGGHNFTVVSTATRPIHSHHLRAQVIVCCDERSYNNHKHQLAPGGVLVYNSDVQHSGEGIGVPMTSEAKKCNAQHLKIAAAAVGALAASIKLDKEYLKRLIEAEFPRDIEHNITYINAIYDAVSAHLTQTFTLAPGDKKRPLVSGNEALCLGAAAGGLDFYVAYPMTPASSILSFLAKKGKDLGVVAFHAENEIAVVNVALGAAYAGARTMIGSSGGGFALFQEGFSMAGITETPILCALASRPGPATGVPTYTGQGDLRFAINQGHGEFTRVVASPGSFEESYTLAAELMDLTWRFQIPAIYMTDKHLAEGMGTFDLDPSCAAWPFTLMARPDAPGKYNRYALTADGISPMMFPGVPGEMIKYNSYEHSEDGITTEDPKTITDQVEKRMRKHASLIAHMKTLQTVRTFGSKDKNKIILAFGSTLMSVREALVHASLDATVVQPIYLEPFPLWELDYLKGKELIVVETTATGQFAQLIEEKLGVKPKAVIKRYDGRAFEPSELAARLKEVL